MSDNQILLIASGACILSICFLFRINKKIAAINLAIFFLYGGYFSFQLENNSEYGSGLVWWSFFVMAALVQTLVVTVFIAAKMIRKRR